AFQGIFQCPFQNWIAGTVLETGDQHPVAGAEVQSFLGGVIKTPSADGCHEEHSSCSSACNPAPMHRPMRRWLRRFHFRDWQLVPIQSFNGSTKTIAAARYGLDEFRFIGGIAQRVAQSVDCAVEAVFKIYERARRPQFLLNLFSGDQLAGTSNQHGENFKGLIVQFQPNTMLAQFSGGHIRYEGPEAQASRRLGGGSNGRVPLLDSLLFRAAKEKT